MMDTLKVISLFKNKKYEELFPNISILGRGFDFFLECTSYDVIIPVKKIMNNRLDIFEEAVLRFIKYHPLEVDEMADVLCLSPDLINFIIIRLQEMEVLGPNGREITELGNNFLNPGSSEIDKSSVDNEFVKIFVANQTGMVLPYIHKGGFSSEIVEDYTSKLRINVGTIGSPYIIEGNVLSTKNSKRNSLPMVLENHVIKKALKNFNNIVASTGKYDEINILSGWGIDNSRSDIIYFHMKAALQEGNIDKILVSDGFVFNVDSIGASIKESFQPFFSFIKERSTENILKSENEKTGNDYYRGSKYFQLGYIINRIQEFSDNYLKNIEDKGLSIDEMQKYEADQKNFFLDIYSAFEWSLYYHSLEYPLSIQMREVINNQSRLQNEKTIYEMARKIGIFQKHKSLFCMLDREKINQMNRNEIPELRVALGISIISAANDNTSPFRTLLKEQPNILNVLENLVAEHGALAHETITYEKNEDKCRELYETLMKCVTILQPNLEFDNETVIVKRKDSLSQIKLNAEVSLAKRLGDLYFYNLLPARIKKEWILVAPDKITYPEPTEYINTLYRIMQDTFALSLDGVVDHIQVSKDTILKRLKSQNIDVQVFNTVNEGYIKSIFKNKTGTLGSYGMVYLYHQSDEIIQLLVKNGFIEVIEFLVELRQHGNKQLFNVDTSKLNEIRDKMLDIVKIMGGI